MKSKLPSLRNHGEQTLYFFLNSLREYYIVLKVPLQGSVKKEEGNPKYFTFFHCSEFSETSKLTVCATR